MPVSEKLVSFSVEGGKPVQGYLVVSTVAASLPVSGLILIHEWWGLNDHIKDVAKRLAEQGYVVLAPDLYSGKSTKDAGEAGRLMQGLDKELALRVLNSAIDYLWATPLVEGQGIGVIGFCMGGSFALLLACRNHNVKAVIPFYGEVPADGELESLSAPVLFIGAENDKWITQDKMSRLEAALERFGKAGEVKVYSGVDHAFFNDTRPDAYNEVAAKDVWQRVLQFLAWHILNESKNY